MNCYAKKDNNDYYYLVSKEPLQNTYIMTSNTNYRPVNFSESVYTLYTKSDYSKFAHDELINGMYQVSYLIKLAEKKDVYKNNKEMIFKKK